MRLQLHWILAAIVVFCDCKWVWTCSQSSSAESMLSVEVIPSPISKEATCGEWVSWVPPKTDPAIVMQVVSKAYVDMERNFVRLMERNSAFTRQHLYLVCLDDPSVERFADLGIRCVPTSARRFRSRKDLWKTRVRILSCLVVAGYNVIMSDSDALWLGDPMEYMDLPGVTSSSIVASRGSFPRKIGIEWGSTLCMGFIMFRSTGAGMKTFQDTMESIVLATGDDQIAVNQAAFELGVSWDAGSDMRYKGSTAAGEGTITNLLSDDGEPFKITLLPHNKFTRICRIAPVSNETMVAHCIKQQHAGAKTDWMQDLNVWSPEVGSA